MVETAGKLCFLFQAILVGDFILSAASMALARIGNITVVKVLSQVIEDLVRGTFCHVSLIVIKNTFLFIRHKLTQLCFVGEFMQLGSKENENERFKHYLEKTFKKTASLIANSCKAVCTFHPHAYVSEWREALVSTLDPSVVVD